MAAPSAAIRAGAAFVELTANDSALQAALGRAQRRMAVFGASIQAVAQKMAIAGAAMVAPFALGVREFATFEQSMARVKALTGATGDVFRGLSDEARRLGAETVFTASQAADAMGFFALAGFRAEQIMAAIGPTLNLAAAGQIGVAEAADIAAKIMAGMGVEATDLGNAIDILTKAMTTANTDLRQLGDAMKYVGPVAKTAGLSIEETVAAVQLLSNAGIQADMAGTTLRGALLSLTSPSEEANQVLTELGVAVNDTSGNVRSLADIIDDLNAGIGDVGTGARLGIIGRIFDARQAAGFAELLSQGGDRLRRFTAALQQSGGTASRIATVQLNTLSGSAVILRSALEGLGISVGEAFGSVLRVALDRIIAAVNATSEFVKSNQALVLVGGAVAAGVVAASAALFGVAVALKAAAFALGALGAGFAALQAVAVSSAAALALVASPIGAMAAAVGALGVAFAAESRTIGAALAWVSDRFSAAGESLMAMLDGMRDALVGGDMAAAARVLWGTLRVAWETGIASLRSAWESFRTAFATISVHAFASVRRAWVDFSAWMYSNFPALTAGLATTWADMTAGLRDVWSRFQNWLSDQWLDLMGLVGDLTDAQVAAAKAIGQQDLQDDLARIESDRQRQVIEAERKASLTHAELEQERQADIEEIEANANAALAGIERDADARRVGAEAELADARRALADAVAAAKNIRRDAEAVGPVDDFPIAARNAAAGVASAQASFSTIGTFNPAAVFGLAGGGREERVVTELRRLQQIAEKGNRVNEQQVAWLLQIAGSFA